MIETKSISYLVEKRLEMVCFAQYSVYLHLEGKLLVTVESEFDLIMHTPSRVERMMFPMSQCGLMRLLELRVISANVSESGDLQVKFSNGDLISVPKQPGYESYRIQNGDAELIV